VVAIALYRPSSCHGIVVGSDGTRRRCTRGRSTAMGFGGGAGFRAAKPPPYRRLFEGAKLAPPPTEPDGYEAEA
jgi:hypothetical protein